MKLINILKEVGKDINVSKKLNEELYKFNNLTDQEQNDFFEIFKKSYEDSLGTSWSKEKFYSRVRNWIIYGDKKGFIALRPQKSGYYKLVGVGGNPRSILNAIDEIQSNNLPIWGMVSKDIQKIMLKKGFKTPPSFLLKILLKFIPNSVFGDTDFEINSDGSLTLKYSDVGDSVKYFIGNEEYLKKLKQNILPQIKDKISELPLIARKGIELFLNESKNNKILNEEITSGSVIVYHRTGKNGQSPVEGIQSDGYRIRNGAAYGHGVYTTYDLESQLNNYMRTSYGSIIIENKVLSLNKFLIFDYDVAKRVYGNNYPLEKQLRIILGKDFDEYRNNDNFKNIIERLQVVKYSSEVVQSLYRDFPEIFSKLKGIIFTGGSDGKVLVSYDRKNVEPIRYSTDDGKTWKNIINKSVYNRIKGYEEPDTIYSHIINKLDNNADLTSNEFKHLFNNPNLLNSIIDKLNSRGISNLFRYSNEPDNIINKLGQKGIDYINNLDSYSIGSLLQYSKEPDKIINILLSNENFINNLVSNGIGSLLRYSKEPDKIINILLSNEKIINNLYSNGIDGLLKNSKEPDKVINKLGQKGIDYINNLDSYSIGFLLQYSKEPDKIINILLSNENFINNLVSNGIYYLLNYSKEPDKIINILLSNEKFINNIPGYVLFYSNEPDKIMKILGQKGIDYINNMNPDEIRGLLLKSIEPEKIMKILGQKGIDYINNMTSFMIKRLLLKSIEPEKIMKILGQKGIDCINNLNSNEIDNLLKNSKEPEKVHNMLMQYGKIK